MVPRSIFPFALAVVEKVQEPEPLAAFPFPSRFTAPALAAHVTRVGRTGEPSLVTRTAATTDLPALGVAGEIFARLTSSEVPPPPPPPPDVGAATVKRNDRLLSERSGSTSGDVTDAVTT
jgi:hypothetical protein